MLLVLSFILFMWVKLVHFISILLLKKYICKYIQKFPTIYSCKISWFTFHNHIPYMCLQILCVVFVDHIIWTNMFTKRNLNIQCKLLHTEEGKETMKKGKDNENIARGGNSYSVNKLFYLWFIMLITYLSFFRIKIFVTPLEREKWKKLNIISYF